MVFLVKQEIKNILCVRNAKQAMEIVKSIMEKEDKYSLGIYGANNKDLFLKIYHEFKYYTFISI